MLKENKQTTIKPPVTAKLLREIVRRIVAKINPEKIILFGSHAYGHPNSDSDLDLLIIKKTKLSVSKRFGVVSDALYPRLIPMDFIVRTPEEIKKRLAGFDPFVKEVIGRGKVLYESRLDPY
ncbi:nucleotidyltransferase domain-containing protein [Candidatus Saganbacteria bacterium]|nr:nucleotidyltransferase domain-containing protein [Candidatus Saganbacteria bacterium]